MIHSSALIQHQHWGPELGVIGGPSTAVVPDKHRGVDAMHLPIQKKRGARVAALTAALLECVKNALEIMPEAAALISGTPVRKFEIPVKAPRFVDARQ